MASGESQPVKLTRHIIVKTDDLERERNDPRVRELFKQCREAMQNELHAFVAESLRGAIAKEKAARRTDPRLGTGAVTIEGQGEIPANVPNVDVKG